MNDDDFAAFVGIDWADQEHAVVLHDPARGRTHRECLTLAQTPEALGDWALGLCERFAGRPVAVAVELSRGPLIWALMKHPHIVIHPLPPARLANYRKAFVTSGAKDDPTDAALILDYLLCHRDQLRPWRPDDAQTRQLQRLVEDRRRFVDQRTAIANALKAQLKGYFPQAIAWLGDKLTSRMAADFLLKWPDLASLQKARPDTVRRFFYAHNVRRGDVIQQRLDTIADATALTGDVAVVQCGVLATQAMARLLRQLVAIIDRYDTQIAAAFADHADAHLFANLPGAGPAMAPRLLAAFGANRARFADAAQLQTLSGIAPVTKRSGKQCAVQRRWACPTFLHQSFHEFAQHSVAKCPWAHAYYQLQISRGHGHHATVRALAFKWIRILFVCWKTRTPYDEARYLRQLQHRGSPLCQYLQPA